MADGGVYHKRHYGEADPFPLDGSGNGVSGDWHHGGTYFHCQVRDAGFYVYESGASLAARWLQLESGHGEKAYACMGCFENSPGAIHRQRANDSTCVISTSEVSPRS